jgi:hypothetical protein
MFRSAYQKYASLFPLTGTRFDKHYRQCSISILDTIADPFIYFDSKGVSCYHYYYHAIAKRQIINGPTGKQKWLDIAKKIHDERGNNKYDCLIGLSGGIDSTYTCLLAKEQGLNPLILHLDNTWDSEQAIHNIEKALDVLQFDFYTHVIDKTVFRNLQYAYLKSSVIDLDIISDHAIRVLLYQKAIEHNIKYVITGGNAATEKTLPPSWLYDYTDQKNIHAIIRHSFPDFINLDTYPTASQKELLYLSNQANITFVDPLDWLEYDVNKTQKILEDNFNWKAFNGKHHESTWTRFYQCYILPVKFHIDKRKAHLSDLIFCNQLTKKEALEIISTPPYSYETFSREVDTFLMRMDMTISDLDNLMSMPIKKHTDYEHETNWRNRFPKMYQMASRAKRLLAE